MSDLKIKVCGMKFPENVESVCTLRPDYIGYIFYPESPRYVGMSPDPMVFSLVPDYIQKVAVFVNESAKLMLELTDKFNIPIIQLHGNESAELCAILKKEGRKIIKAFPGNEKTDQAKIDGYVANTDHFLFDTPVKGFGGSGKKFDWAVLENLKIQKPFFLSGGISPGDAREIRKFRTSGFFGIDINSRFETEYGLKNLGLLQGFFNIVRNEK